MAPKSCMMRNVFFSGKSLAWNEKLKTAVDVCLFACLLVMFVWRWVWLIVNGKKVVVDTFTPFFQLLVALFLTTKLCPVKAIINQFNCQVFPFHWLDWAESKLFPFFFFELVRWEWIIKFFWTIVVEQSSTIE